MQTTGRQICPRPLKHDTRKEPYNMNGTGANLVSWTYNQNTRNHLGDYGHVAILSRIREALDLRAIIGRKAPPGGIEIRVGEVDGTPLPENLEDKSYVLTVSVLSRTLQRIIITMRLYLRAGRKPTASLAADRQFSSNQLHGDVQGEVQDRVMRILARGGHPGEVCRVLVVLQKDWTEFDTAFRRVRELKKGEYDVRAVAYVICRGEIQEYITVGVKFGTNNARDHLHISVHRPGE